MAARHDSQALCLARAVGYGRQIWQPSNGSQTQRVKMKVKLGNQAMGAKYEEEHSSKARQTSEAEKHGSQAWQPRLVAKHEGKPGKQAGIAS